MSLWRSIKDKAVTDRLADEAFHAAAIDEISSGKRRDGLWAKAVLQSNGNERQAKLAYLRLLVMALKDENYISERINEIHQPTRPEPQRHPPATPFGDSAETSLGASAPSDGALYAFIVVVVLIFLGVVGLSR